MWSTSPTSTVVSSVRRSCRHCSPLIAPNTVIATSSPIMTNATITTVGGRFCRGTRDVAKISPSSAMMTIQLSVVPHAPQHERSRSRRQGKSDVGQVTLRSSVAFGRRGRLRTAHLGQYRQQLPLLSRARLVAMKRSS